MNEDNIVENNEEENVNINRNKPSGNKKTILAIILFVVVILVIGAVFYYKNTDTASTKIPSSKDKVVATVGDTSISQSELDARFKQIADQMKAQGTVITEGSDQEKQLKIKTLENLINDKILLQNAKKSGIKVTTEEIKKETKSIIDRVGSEEKFKEQLKSGGMTEEKFKDIVSNQLTIQKYILANIDINSIKVTDKEISEFYNQVSSAQKNVPPLEKIRSQVESSILANKQRKMVNDFIKTMRKSADVKISL